MIRLLSVAIAGPLERYAEGLVADLLSRQYTRLSSRNLLYVVAHLSRWLAARRLDVDALTSKCVLSFLRSRRRAGYTNHIRRRSLGAVLGYLRRLGVVPVDPVLTPRTPLERLLARYTHYLTQERALAASTVRQRIDTAARFLSPS